MELGSQHRALLWPQINKDQTGSVSLIFILYCTSKMLDHTLTPHLSNQTSLTPNDL